MRLKETQGGSSKAGKGISNVGRKRRVQMRTGMGEVKHGQELCMIYTTPFRKLVNKIPVTKQIK